LGCVAVPGALDAPARHLAFDDARVRAQPAFGERLGEDLGDRLVMRCGEVVGGKIPGGIGCCGGRRGGF
jgi:hypothetical protein